MSRRSSQWRSGRLHKAHKIGRKGIALDTVLYWVIGIAAVALVIYLLTNSSNATKSSLQKCEGGFYAALGKEAKCYQDGQAPSADSEYYYQFVGMGKKAGCNVPGESCYLKIPINENPVSKDEMEAAAEEAASSSGTASSSPKCPTEPGKWGYTINNQCKGDLTSSGSISMGMTDKLEIYYVPSANDEVCRIVLNNGPVAKPQDGAAGTCANVAYYDSKKGYAASWFHLKDPAYLFTYPGDARPVGAEKLNANTAQLTLKLQAGGRTPTGPTVYVTVNNVNPAVRFCSKESVEACRNKYVIWPKGAAGSIPQDIHPIGYTYSSACVFDGVSKCTAG